MAFDNPHKIKFDYMRSTCNSNPGLKFKAKFYFDTNELTLELPRPDMTKIVSQEIKCGGTKLKHVRADRCVTVSLDADRNVWNTKFMLVLNHRNGRQTDRTKYQFEVTFMMNFLVSSSRIVNIFRFLASKPKPS